MIIGGAYISETTPNAYEIDDSLGAQGAKGGGGATGEGGAILMYLNSVLRVDDALSALL